MKHVNTFNDLLSKNKLAEAISAIIFYAEDTGKKYIFKGGDPTVSSNWEEFSINDGLMEVTENGNTGVRLYGEDQLKHGNIGDRAVDLSIQTVDNTTKGATGQYSFAEGSATTASGVAAHAEGSQTTASGSSSHAEGSATTASGVAAHAEGYNTIASGVNSHTEGSGTAASEFAAHAEGYNTHAQGNHSHSEGWNTLASGEDSHAEGSNTTASGKNSHAEGYNTIAGFENQSVCGKYNNNKSDTLFEVGNGTDNIIRSNAFEVKANGDIELPVQGNGVILKDTVTGTRYRITIASGALTLTAL